MLSRLRLRHNISGMLVSLSGAYSLWLMVPAISFRRSREMLLMLLLLVMISRSVPLLPVRR